MSPKPIALLMVALLTGPAIAGDRPVPVTPGFNFRDERPAAEREGFPYPGSRFTYTMHGDTSLDVNRLALLQTRITQRLGKKLSHKTLALQKFYVMEANVRPSFVRDASGKTVPNTGLYEPTLFAEIAMLIGDQLFTGFGQLKLPQGSKATHATLTKATTDVVDDMLKDMETRLNLTYEDDD